MWELPKRVVLTAGVGVGTTFLNAFDSALLNAGIGNLNLLRVSSILPAAADIYLFEEDGRKYIRRLANGTVIPAVYGAITSDEPGQAIASALAVGLPKEQECLQSGVIFEVTIIGNKRIAEERAADMAADALAMRNVHSYDMVIVSAEIAISDKPSCAVSAALLLP